MPPGTGGTQLTFAQEINMDGVIIISTPQELALQDVKRGIKMFDKLGVKIIGLWFLGALLRFPPQNPRKVSFQEPI